MEGILKIKEISYIHAEAFAAGELKHGSIALIDKGTQVVAIANQSVLFEKWFLICKKYSYNTRRKCRSWKVIW